MRTLRSTAARTGSCTPAGHACVRVRTHTCRAWRGVAWRVATDREVGGHDEGSKKVPAPPHPPPTHIYTPWPLALAARHGMVCHGMARHGVACATQPRLVEE